VYPSHFFELFRPFPRRDAVFVAMSFDSKFDGSKLSSLRFAELR
jgi:hypothetical protein